MKCKYCGGDVTLDDHFCPNCGRPVDQSQRHHQEMKQYETEFEETRQEALEKISVSSGGGTAVGIRLAAIIVLVIAIVTAFIRLDPYYAAERKAARDVKKHFAEYTQEVNTLLENRDYLALSSFIKVHDLNSNDQFREYSEIFDSVYAYTRIYQGLQQLAFSDEDSIQSMYYLQTLSRSYNDFYERMNERHYSWTEDIEKTEAAAADMEADLAVLVQKYLGLTKEETDSLKGLSDSRRTILLESAIDEKLTQKAGISLSDIEDTAPQDMEMPGSKEMPSEAGAIEEEPSQTDSTQGE